jgi:2-dehydro-3-deoxyphosphogluconate aldolase/(4S)-4-hydroxy-2-oxoglutarate aldolase
MRKSDVLDSIRASKIVAIIREEHPDVAFRAAMACVEGGISCLEIALTTPCGLDVVESLVKVGNVTVGAGTVLDAETAKASIQAGASFLLSPAVDPAVILNPSEGAPAGSVRAWR